MPPPSPPPPLAALVDRYDRQVFPLTRGEVRVRLRGAAAGAWDARLEADGPIRLEPADEGVRPDATLEADAEVWRGLADGSCRGMAAFQAGRLQVRHDLHLGVGFLAATTGADGLRFRRLDTGAGPLSALEAGTGRPVLLLHGLGATKASLLPSVAALARDHRAIALDLPGFGDSAKPLGAPYDAPYFADAVAGALDALELDRADLVGNSLGGRIAIETGLRHPARVRRLVLLAPSLAWLRDRPWAPLLRLIPPQLGALQPAPRALVEQLVRGVVPGAREGWSAAGVDEFLRAYLTPGGRVAFYASARNIYLEEPHGPDGFWTRLPGLAAPSLFVWGRQDQLIPIAFAEHVRRALPAAEHLELACGHVPQLERPGETHAAIRRFLQS